MKILPLVLELLMRSTYSRPCCKVRPLMLLKTRLPPASVPSWLEETVPCHSTPPSQLLRRVTVMVWGLASASR